MDERVFRNRTGSSDGPIGVSGGTARSGGRFHRVLIPVLAAAGVTLRIAPMCQEFWYDEVVSLRIAFMEPGAGSIFFPPRLLDTPMNQIVLRAIGPATAAWWYRLPSLIAGVATLILLYLLARRRGRHVSGIALLLAAFSYTMIHYSSEARGYALAMCMSLAAFLALEKIRGEAGEGGIPLVLFWLSSIAGFLSHPTFVLFYAGALGGSLAGGLFPSGRNEAWRASHAKAHGPVLLFLGTYFVWLQGQKLGEPLVFDSAQVALDFLDFSFGMPGVVSGRWAAVPLLILAVVIFLGIRRDWNEGRRERCFFLGAAAAAAIVIFVVGRPVAFFPRYLGVLLPFLLLAAAEGLNALCDCGAPGNLTVAVFLALFLAGNGYHLKRFLEDGRGHYQRAFQEMAERTEGNTIFLSADNDGRLEPMIWFGARAVERSTGKRFRLVGPAEFLAGMETEWVVLHSYERDTVFPAEVRVEGLPSYRCARVYPHYGLSGLTWSVYRKVGLQPLAR